MEEILAQKRRSIRRIGITIASQASFSFLIGIATFIIINLAEDSKHFVPMIGEQLWAPVIILMSTRSMHLPNEFTFKKVRNCMVISLFCSIVSLCLFLIECFFAIIYNGNNYVAYKMLTGLNSLLAFLCFVFSIITSTYCCTLLPECDCCYGNQAEDFYMINLANRLNGFSAQRNSSVAVTSNSQHGIDTSDPPPPYPGPPVSSSSSASSSTQPPGYDATTSASAAVAAAATATAAATLSSSSSSSLSSNLQQRVPQFDPPKYSKYDVDRTGV